MRWDRQELVISNPGGFVEGVSLQNLLVVEPKPRNPVLADAIKRIGLAERTGRGVDLIYEGMLRYGRPAPDYSFSDATTVAVHLKSAEADIPFLKMILQEEQRTGAAIPLESLILLAGLREARRLDVVSAASAIQRSETAARGVLERLVEAGLVEPHGATRGRVYTLSPAVYRQLGRAAGYVRQAGFDPLQQEQMVLKWVAKHGRITRADAAELCRLSGHQASRLLKRLCRSGRLVLHGEKRGSYYTLPPQE